MKRAAACPSARSLGLLLSLLVFAYTAQAQHFVSVKAGIIQFIQGEVLLDDKPVQQIKGSYLQIDNGQRLSTKNGRVEMLLAPDVYFRLDKNGSVQMVQNQFDDTKLQLEQGSALIEVDRMLRGNLISVLVSNAIVEIREEGLYRFDAGPGELRVYGGAALVTAGDKEVEIKKGRMVRLHADPVAQKNDPDTPDPLHKWAAQRSFDLFITRPFPEKHKHWSMALEGQWMHDSYQVLLSVNQHIASLFPGSIQYIQGEAFLDDNRLQLPEEGYEQIENGQRLSTKAGYVELVLSTGIYFRLGQNGSLRMKQNVPGDIQIELENGSALVEVTRVSKKERACVHLSASVVEFRKTGLYRIDAVPGELRVHDGAARVTQDVKKAEIKKGKMVELSGDLVPVKAGLVLFDPLHKWAAQRSFSLFIAGPIAFNWRHWRPQSEGWWSHDGYRLKLISDQSAELWAQYMGRLDRLRTVEGELGVVNAAGRYQSLTDQANQQSLQAIQVKWEETMEEARKAGLAGESAQTPAGPPQ
jgi:hypothetical protein